MRLLNILRVLLAVTIVTSAVFYIRLSQGKEDKSRFLISTVADPLISIEGDYTGRVNIIDDTVKVDESIVFPRDTLVQLIKKERPGSGSDYWSGDEYTDSPGWDTAQINEYIRRYLSELKDLGWEDHSSAGNPKMVMVRNTYIPFSIGILEKTKRLAIPVLFTNVSELVHRTSHTGYIVVNDSVGKLTYDGNVDYILSENSKVTLKAREGMVERIFPEAKKLSLIDQDNSDVFLFDIKTIGSSLQHTGSGSTTINVEILNPRYNNMLGRLVRNWSGGQILVWTIVSVLALFADKIKELVFRPFVNSFFQKRKTRQDPTPG